MSNVEKKRFSLRGLFRRRPSSTRETSPFGSLSPLDVVGPGLVPWDGHTK